MRRLTFIDDDKEELNKFSEIVEGEYEYTLIHWPDDKAKLFGDSGPDIFVSDLYLPSSSGDTEPTKDQVAKAAQASQRVAKSFRELYASPAHKFEAPKKRLRGTMAAIDEGYQLLKQQWSNMGQSPDHGIWLLGELRKRFSAVPLVFYSRKITPEDIIRVLRAGAVDAIRKGAFGRRELLARLACAEEVWHRGDVQGIKARGLNVNVTSVSGN